MNFVKVYYLPLILTVLNTSGQQSKKPQEQKKPNVLFIAVDDLRLQANLYGQQQMKTPNLDRLGAEGVAFTKAYCSVPVCGASRASLLSGVRPTSTRFVNYYTRKDTDFPNYPSLPKYFKDNGYTTISNGKIYHHVDDDKEAWSEKPFIPNPGLGWQNYLSEESKKIVEKNFEIQKAKMKELSENFTDVAERMIKGPAWECIDVADNAYPDGMLADKSIADLQRLTEKGAPFFLAVGFWKPHLPFNAPKKYWDLYNEHDIVLADNPYKPKNVPEEAMHTWGELRGMYDNIPQEGNLPDSIARKLMHGYYACVSYSDAQIGKLLEELDRLGIAENTIVVLWGDHGWHLGEHTLWCKHCNFDRVMNAPLIVRAPGKQKGEKSSSITEFIDIYPSLCELCNLPVPQHLDGKSFVSVLDNPKKEVKTAAFVKYLGAETVVTERYNFTEFLDKNGTVKSNMLYDLKKDPKENENISKKESNKKLVEKLSTLLNEVKQTKVKQL
jgi:arylsulfatase A-like enzyme